MNNLFIDFLNTSITASYIIIAVFLIRLIFKKIPRKFICVLWAIAGLRLVLPFSIESAFSLIPSAETFEPVSANTPGLRINSGISVIDMPVNDYLGDRYAEGITVPANLKDTIASVAAVVWVAGIAAILLYGIFSYLKLKKTVSTAVLLKDNIMQSESVVSPFILGIFKPKIYIPFGMDEETQSYVVSHEAAHIKRRDHWIKPIGFLILAVYWFNPLVWAAYIMLCRDIERACDEKVIARMDGDERKEYANALLDCAVNRRRIAACPLAFGEVGIKERIKGVMNYKKPAFWVIVVAVIACIVAAVCFLTNPKNEANDDYEYPYRIVAEINYDDSGREYTKVLSAKKGDKHTVIDGVEFEVADVNLQEGEIDIGFIGEKLPVSAFSNKPLSLLIVNLTQSHRVKTADGAEITFSFVMTQTLDDAVSKAILDYHDNQDIYKEGSAAFESHEILKVERDKGFVGSDDAEDVTVYLIMAYGKYVYNNGEVESVGGASGPIALHFSYINGIYTLTEYWQPEDGSYYTDSIREKFPFVIAEIAIHRAVSVSQTPEEKAKVYFEGLDNGCAVNTGVDGFNATVLAMPIYGDNPYIEIEWENGTSYDIACTGTHGMRMYIDRSWVDVQTGAIFEPTYLKIIEPGEAYTVKYSLDMFDIEADGLYRFTDVFTVNGENVIARIDFNKGPVKGDSDEEEPTTIAVIADEPQFDTSEYSSVNSVAKGRFIARKLVDGSPYSALLDENGKEIIPFFRGEIRRINDSGEIIPILSVEPLYEKDILTDSDGNNISDYEFNGTGFNNSFKLIYGYTDDEYVFFSYSGEYLTSVKEGETVDLQPWDKYIVTVKHCGNCFRFGAAKDGKQIVPCEYDEIEVVSSDRIVARIGEAQGLDVSNILRIFDGSGKQLTNDGDYSNASFSWDDEYGIASKLELLEDDYKITCWIIDKNGSKLSEGYDNIYKSGESYVGEKDGMKNKIKL